MRRMWQEFGRAAPAAEGAVARPYTMQDLRRVLADVSGDRAFADDFFDRFVQGREVLDYAPLLARAGLILRKRSPGRPWIGDVSLDFSNGTPRIAVPTRRGHPGVRRRPRSRRRAAVVRRRRHHRPEPPGRGGPAASPGDNGAAVDPPARRCAGAHVDHRRRSAPAARPRRTDRTAAVRRGERAFRRRVARARSSETAPVIYCEAPCPTTPPATGPAPTSSVIVIEMLTLRGSVVAATPLRSVAMHLLDWAVVAAYVAWLVWDGVKRTKLESTTESYFLANRSMPWWAVGLSVMATQLSAITLVGTTGQGYNDGLRFVQFYYGLPIAMIILCVTLVPFFYRARVYTAYEYLERRFDLKTRTFTSGLFLVSRAMSCGAIAAAPGRGAVGRSRLERHDDDAPHPGAGRDLHDARRRAGRHLDRRQDDGPDGVRARHCDGVPRDGAAERRSASTMR